MGEQINIELDTGEIIELHFSSMTQAVKIIQDRVEIGKLSARGGSFSQVISGKSIEIVSKRQNVGLSGMIADVLAGVIRMNKVEARVNGELVFEGYAGQ